MEVTSSGLRTDQLEWIVKRVEAYAEHCKTGCRSVVDCLGVFSADKIPSRVTVDRHLARLKLRSGGNSLVYFIANTDPARKAGSHWVAFVVFASHPTVIEYFDSFGLALDFYDELKRVCLRLGYFRSTSTLLCVNTQALQCDSTSVCGHYCVIFLVMCARTHSGLAAVRAIRKLGHGDCLSRDRCVLQFVNRLQEHSQCLCFHAPRCSVVQCCCARVPQ